MSTESKVCSICKTAKPLEAFHLGKGTHGRHTYCRQCQSALSRERYKNRGAETSKIRPRDMMPEALAAVDAGMSLRDAANHFGMSKVTLQRGLRKRDDSVSSPIQLAYLEVENAWHLLYSALELIPLLSDDAIAKAGHRSRREWLEELEESAGVLSDLLNASDEESARRRARPAH